MKIAFVCIVTLTLSTAFDLSVSAAMGYTLRSAKALLIAVDALFRSSVVVPLIGLSAWARVRGSTQSLWTRVPRTCVLAAAILPVLWYRAAQAGGRAGSLAALLQLAAFVAAGALEARRFPARPGRAFTGIALAASIVAIFVVATRPSPGRSLLSPSAASSVATPEAPNLLMVVLDTTRADHLGLYGYARRTTPWLDRFASEATVFERAVSPSSWTLPAHATLFTGLYPRAHGAHALNQPEEGTSLHALGRGEDVARVRPLSDAAVTLAELARDAGLATGAVCANTGFLYRGLGLAQGFDTYVDARAQNPAWRPLGLTLALLLTNAEVTWPLRRLVLVNEIEYLTAPEVNALAQEWLDAHRGRRFFLFLNYMDAHGPWLPRGPTAKQFGDAMAAPKPVDYEAVRARRREILPQERRTLVDRYDAELSYLDDHLRELFDRIDGWGLLADTLVVIVGDHGESFGEHHDIGHGHGVYEHELWVPLIVRFPGQSTGRRVSPMVHLVDVFPTVTEALGLRSPPGADGRSLLSLEDGRTYFASTGPFRRYLPYRRLTHHAVYKDPWKLVARSDGSRELYRLSDDPLENRNLAERNPDAMADLWAELERFEARGQPSFAEAASTPSAAAADRLRALGYAE